MRMKEKEVEGKNLTLSYEEDLEHYVCLPKWSLQLKVLEC